MHFGVFLSFWDPLGVELGPMSIFTGGKRAATLPEIQNSIKLEDLDLETYLTRKSANNHEFWCISQLLEPSGRGVMADVNFHWWEARSYITRNQEFYKIKGFRP